MFATYLPPTQEILDQPNRIRAVRMYRDLPHTLLDGTRIVPSLSVCMGVIKAWKSGLRFPTVVEANSYETVEALETKKRLRAERFASFAKDDGLTMLFGTVAYDTVSCSCCGKEVRRYYSPDAMDYPQWTMGGECSDDPFAEHFGG